MTELVDLGRNIVLLRKAQELTQEQLAFRSDLSVSRLQDIEYGIQNTTVDTIIAIANTLHVDSRIISVFRMPDWKLISAFHRPPLLPIRVGNELQICENISLLRQARGLTQAQLAAIANISVACLRDIEHGCANITTNKLSCVAQAFGMSLLELNALAEAEADVMESIDAARAILWRVPALW